MASNVLPVPASAQQPGLTSFIVFGEIPDGYVAVEVTDDAVSPHLRRGDFAIIDTEDRSPAHGDIFLVEGLSGTRRFFECGRFPRPERLRPRDGEHDPAGYWNLYYRNATFTLYGRVDEVSRWVDGPYGGSMLPDMLLGRVVGIYQPDFRAQLRLAA